MARIQWVTNDQRCEIPEDATISFQIGGDTVLLRLDGESITVTAVHQTVVVRPGTSNQISIYSVGYGDLP